MEMSIMMRGLCDGDITRIKYLEVSCSCRQTTCVRHSHIQILFRHFYNTT